jgi:hypothetical protein
MSGDPTSTVLGAKLTLQVVLRVGITIRRVSGWCGPTMVAIASHTPVTSLFPKISLSLVWPL